MFKFEQKTLKYFNDFQNQNFAVETKVNPSNGHETKSGILPWDIFVGHFITRKMLRRFTDFYN